MSLLLPRSPELTWTGTTPVSYNPFAHLYFPKSQGKKPVVWHIELLCLGLTLSELAARVVAAVKLLEKGIMLWVSTVGWWYGMRIEVFGGYLQQHMQHGHRIIML